MKVEPRMHIELNYQELSWLINVLITAFSENEPDEQALSFAEQFLISVGVELEEEAEEEAKLH